MVQLSSLKSIASCTLVGLAFGSVNATSVAQTEFQQPSLPLDSQSCAFIGVFEQSKTLKGLTVPLDSNGSFYYHCEYGVIWKSEKPSPESLIFQKNGAAFKFDEKGEANQIKSQQGKVLGRLLNDLIGIDLKRLAHTFKLEQLEPNAIRFVPRKRRLKRALKMVNLVVKKQDIPAVEISIIDRNDQVTRVSALQTHTLEPLTGTPKALTQCVQDTPFSTAECSLLIDRGDPLSK